MKDGDCYRLASKMLLLKGNGIMIRKGGLLKRLKHSRDSVRAKTVVTGPGKGGHGVDPRNSCDRMRSQEGTETVP